MPITRTAMIDDDGSGTTGTILNNAWKQELYNQIDALAASAIVEIPFNAASFYAGAGGTWTVTAGQVVTWCATRTQAAGTIYLHIDNSTVASAPSILHVNLPAGFLPSKTVGIVVPFLLGAVTVNGFCLVDPASERLFLGRDAAFGVAFGAGSTSVRVAISYPMLPAAAARQDDAAADNPGRRPQ